LDKNHTTFENFQLLEENLVSSSSNLLFYENAFSKIQLIKEIISKQTLTILYIDLDHFVIFDSINGLYNTLSNDADSGRMVNSILMLLARNVTFSNSILIISALATKKENDWVLPNGRQILENENMKKFVISDRSKITIEK
jgi:hypothetical protein